HPWPAEVRPCVPSPDVPDWRARTGVLRPFRSVGAYAVRPDAATTCLPQPATAVRPPALRATSAPIAESVPREEGSWRTAARVNRPNGCTPASETDGDGCVQADQSVR